MTLYDKVTDKEYKDIKNRNINSKRVVILVFTSKTCPHCRSVESFLKRLYEDKNNKYLNIEVYFIQSEKANKALKKHQVRAFPTTVFLHIDKNRDSKYYEQVVGGDLQVIWNEINKGISYLSKEEKSSFFDKIKNIFK
jgi:thiol-disulfide isomerase/thioredoxin